MNTAAQGLGAFLPEETKQKIIEAFLVFDEENVKMVDVREVGPIMRSLDLCPTERDVREVVEEMDDPQIPGGMISLERFLPVMISVFLNNRFKAPEKDTVMAAFEALDVEKKGYLTADELTKYVTASGGEPFSQQDLDELLTAAVTVNPDGSQVVERPFPVSLDGSPRKFLGKMATWYTEEPHSRIIPSPPQRVNRNRTLHINLRNQILDLAYESLAAEVRGVEMCNKTTLDSAIENYLSIVPHERRFQFATCVEIFQRGLQVTPFFLDAFQQAWEHLALYAANFLMSPWRPEFKTLRLYTGFFRHFVEPALPESYRVFALMGYSMVLGENNLVLRINGPLDLGTILSVYVDCLIASCECQVMAAVLEKLQDSPATLQHVIQAREKFAANVDQTAAAIRQELRMESQLRCEDCLVPRHPLPPRRRNRRDNHQQQQQPLLVPSEEPLWNNAYLPRKDPVWTSPKPVSPKTRDLHPSGEESAESWSYVYDALKNTSSADPPRSPDPKPALPKKQNKDVKLKPQANKWSCKACTYLNPENVKICGMCAKSKDVCSVDLKSDVEDSANVECSKCTFLNAENAANCAMCGEMLEVEYFLQHFVFFYGLVFGEIMRERSQGSSDVIDALKARVAKVEEELEDVCRENEGLSLELIQCQRRLFDANRELLRIQDNSVNNDLSGEVEELRQQVKQLRKERDDVAAVLSKEQNDSETTEKLALVKTMKVELLRMQEMLQRRDHQISFLSTTAMSLSSKLSESLKSLEFMKNANQRMMKREKELGGKLSAADVRVNEAAQTIKSLSNDLHDARTKARELELRLRDAIEVANTAIQEKDVAEESEESARTRCDEIVTSFKTFAEEAIGNAHQEMEEYRKKYCDAVDDLRLKLTEVQKEKEQLKQELHQFAKTKSVSLQTPPQYPEFLQVQQEKCQLEDTLKDVRDDMESAKRKWARQRDLFEEKLGHVEKALIEARAANSAKHDEVAMLKKDLRAANSAVAECELKQRNVVEDLRRALDNREEVIELLKREHSDKMAVTESSSLQSVVDLKKMLVEQRRLTDKWKDEAQLLSKNCQERISQLKKDMKKLREEKHELLAQLKMKELEFKFLLHNHSQLQRHESISP
ncbi:unnamed protein product [Notodromas monacha]|uniref:Calmodulin n=1 Tax=Notodromas monacha TaxID=399045 RepID=A0A7R9GFK0_9CRUS|nr:unnamed protein product [Notodromas monacha]CAG0918955.1 unnamed protein product [Notodromas monacha]